MASVLRWRWGNYTVYVILDADDNIGQSDNSDASDLRSTPLTIQAGTTGAPDLTFNGAIGVSPNPVVRGNDVTVSYTMKNIGNATAPESRIRIQIKPVGSTSATADVYQTTSSLAISESRSKTATIAIGSAVTVGNYTVYVILDADDNIGQSNTTDASDLRSTPLTIQVGTTGAPDLTFNGAIGVSPNPVVRGNDVTVSYTMKNIGNATAPESRIRIQIKPAGSTSAIADVYQTTSSLAVGESRSKTAMIGIGAAVAAGSYTVYVILDADDNIGQSNTTDASDLRSTVAHNTSGLWVHGLSDCNNII